MSDADMTRIARQADDLQRQAGTPNSPQALATAMMETVSEA